jgi:hypothetical protein
LEVWRNVFKHKYLISFFEQVIYQDGDFEDLTISQIERLIWTKVIPPSVLDDCLKETLKRDKATEKKIPSTSPVATLTPVAPKKRVIIPIAILGGGQKEIVSTDLAQRKKLKKSNEPLDCGYDVADTEMMQQQKFAAVKARDKSPYIVLPVKPPLPHHSLWVHNDACYPATCSLSPPGYVESCESTTPPARPVADVVTEYRLSLINRYVSKFCWGGEQKYYGLITNYNGHLFEVTCDFL